MVNLSGKIDEILLEAGLLKLDKLKEAWDIQRKTDKALEEILLEYKFVTRKDIFLAQAKKLEVEFLDLEEYEIKDTSVLSLIPENLMRQHCILPVEKQGDLLTVAMSDPKNIFAADDARLASSHGIKPVLADSLEIEKIITKYFDDSAGAAEGGNKKDQDQIGEKEVKPAKTAGLQKKDGIHTKDHEDGSISLSRNRLGDILVKEGVLSREQLKKALEIQKESGGRIGEILITEGYIGKETLYKTLEKQMGVEYIDVTALEAKDEVIGLINESLARRHVVLPFEKDGISLKVAMNDPSNIFSIDDLRLATGFEIIPYLADGDEIIKILDRRKKKRKEASESREKSGSRVKEEGTAKYVDLEEELRKVNEEIAVEIQEDQADEVIDVSDVQNAPIVKMVNLMFNKAAKSGASDIHIEPYEDCVMVRNRIDGQLVEVMTHDKKILPALVARIKIMSGLNIAEKRLPQDGRIAIKIDMKNYDMRVSVLPTMFGEKVVIRLTDKEGFDVKKEELGFFEDDLQKFNEILAYPHGIVLVTGPTGSGKSTTLYTALKELCKPNINILTVEDPVENTVRGVNQVQVNIKAGLTFAAALRSFLRQDPDIIMVGEIRDSETAEIATRAAITGHLVLSTLHTNDAASSISRMIDMGIEPYMISSCIVGVIAQRLVRRLCSKCREEYEPSESEKEALKIASGEPVKIFRAKGCPGCNNTGYKGRIAVYEIMTVDRDITEVIARNVTSNVLKDLAVEKGMKTLRENCSRLVKAGTTSLEEMLRVTYARE